MPATPTGIAIQQPVMAVPPNPIYNPTPPAKPVVKQSAGCLGVMLGTVSLAALVAVMAATFLH